MIPTLTPTIPPSPTPSLPQPIMVNAELTAVQGGTTFGGTLSGLLNPTP